MKEVKEPKKPLLLFYVMMLFLVLLFNEMARPYLEQAQFEKVDYSTFMDMIEDKDIGRVGFDRCRARGCYAEVILQDYLVKQLVTGGKALFIIYDSPEDGMGIPISLKGFKEGFDALP